MTFRLANRNGRAMLVTETGLADLEKASEGTFGPDTNAALARHRELHAVTAAAADRAPDFDLDPAQLGPCVPAPSKVFAAGLNYAEHAKESQMEVPVVPLIFAKFPSCLTGPGASVEVPNGTAVDWEAELVVVVGDRCRNLTVGNAWDHVAGLCVGNDVSDRIGQFVAKPAHFDLGKSWDGFGPIGPAVTSIDAVPDRDDLGITCDVNDERMQDDRTSSMIFGVPALLEHISRFCTLEPGDLVFTGTPDGIGASRGKFLQPGDSVTCAIDGIGAITTRFVAPGTSS